MSAAPAHLPLIAIVIPTFNRSASLRRCIDTLDAQDYPRDRFRILVVDDGSDQPLDALFANRQTGPALTLLRQDNAGPACARNRGASAAGTEPDLLAFIDDDCRADPQWLAALGEAHAREPEAMLGGRTLNALTDNPFSAASQCLIDYLYSYYHETASGFFASNNMAVPARAFADTGGFDTSFARAAGEDREICFRWTRGKRPMRFVPAALVQHAHALNLRNFWKQHLNYGRGAHRFYRCRRRLGARGLTPEPPGFYLRLLRHPKAPPAARSPHTMMLLLGLAQLANAAGFFIEALLSRSDARDA